MSKGYGNNRISALKRLGKSAAITSINRRQLFADDNSSGTVGRGSFVVNRSAPYDGRQVFNRPSSKAFETTPTNVIFRKNIQQVDNDRDKMIVVTGLKNMQMRDGRMIPTATTDNTRIGKNKNIYATGPTTFVTIRNNNNVTIGSNPSTEKVSLTKTITNTAIRQEEEDHRNQRKNTLVAQSNQKVMISVVNDKYQKIPTPPPPLLPQKTVVASNSSPYHDPPPVLRRLHDASIQTTPPAFTSRSPIRINSHRQSFSANTIDDQDRTMTRTIDDEFYEPPVKRTTSTTRKTTLDKEQQPSLASTIATATGATKRTSAGAPVTIKTTSTISSMPKQPIPSTQSQSIPGTILVTNLLPSVSEDDIIELFSQIGRINELITLSAGCVQIVFAKREYAEQAVAKYHNRLLDGQFMYVSLQQRVPSYPTNQPPKPIANPPQPTNQTPKPIANPPQPTNQTPKPIANQPPKPIPNPPQPTKGNGSSTNSSSFTTNQPLKFNTSSSSSNKISMDPAFIRQALFHPSNNTNPVQFQVKL